MMRSNKKTSTSQTFTLPCSCLIWATKTSLELKRGTVVPTCVSWAWRALETCWGFTVAFLLWRTWGFLFSLVLTINISSIFLLLLLGLLVLMLLLELVGLMLRGSLVEPRWSSGFHEWPGWMIHKCRLIPISEFISLMLVCKTFLENLNRNCIILHDILLQT